MPEHSPLYDLARQAGAVFNEDRGWLVPEHYGDPAKEYRAAREGAALFDRSARSKVELAGAEAAQFLHNLSTNDIKGLTPGTGAEAFLTTAKGRLIAPLDLSRLRAGGGNVLLLDTAVGQGEKVCQHLGRFRISEDVAITDRTRALTLMHLCGPAALSLAAQALGIATGTLAPWQHTEEPSNAGTLLVRRHDLLNLPGFDLFAPDDQAPSLWTAFRQAGAAPAGESAFDVLRVEAGLPRFGVDMDEERLVMEIGRTRQAISFTKGCYLGQESIVMARDRGHVNRQLMGLRLSQGGPAPACARVFYNGMEVGQVTSSVTSPRLGLVVALAYLKREAQAPGTTVEIDTGAGRQPASVSELPFA
jgi:folate-binding protein YgfZ